jgi:hypothetical protein
MADREDVIAYYGGDVEADCLDGDARSWQP